MYGPYRGESCALRPSPFSSNYLADAKVMQTGSPDGAFWPQGAFRRLS